MASGLAGTFRGRVTNAGGGEVRILVDRDTENYPSVGATVTVVVERDGSSTAPSDAPTDNDVPRWRDGTPLRGNWPEGTPDSP